MPQTVYLNGEPMHTIGDLPKAGTEAPAFSLVAKDLTMVTLHDYKGRRLVLNIFPSLDTDVCAASVRRFNKMAAELPNTSVLCVSKDLPFAAARFCVVNGIENVTTASAFRSSFGKDYGVELVDGPLHGLLARALVLIDENGNVMATSLCQEITEEPDYDLVLRMLGKTE